MTEQEKQLQIRIRELEKEVSRLHTEIKKNSEQQYGLRWMDVPEAFENASENSIPILEEVKEKTISNDDEKPTHIIIEGDNFHALTCLNYTHKGKIDMIYIDPPYNTGSDGFVYKDKRVLDKFPDGTTVPTDHPLRHSYWLSFMHKRLELAKNLLSERGVIFISIDDYEQANLKILCDQVFGENNFVNQFVWKRNSSGKTEKDKFTVNTEYVLLYRRGEECMLNDAFKPLSQATIALYKLDDHDGRGKYRLYPLQKPASPGPETTYDYIDNTGKVWKCPPKGWRMKYEKLKALENEGRLCLENKSLSEKAYWNERASEGKRIDTLWDDLPENSAGTGQLVEIFGDYKTFSNPKPTELIKRCLQINTNDAIILDFFAGSGTTMHATMLQNEKDKGHRQCILVQQNENNICENVTYERNRRVMQGYTNTKGEQVTGLGNSLKYYRTAFVGEHQAQAANDQDSVALAQKAGCLLALAENTLDEIETYNTWQLFRLRKGDQAHNGCVYTAVYFSGALTDFPDFVHRIEQIQQNENHPSIAVYIFCWGSVDIYENEFDDLRGITLKPIPQPILNIYKSINV